MSVPISNVPRRVQYAPSGVGPYAFTFEILVNTDIAVYVGTSLKTLTADYTVSINPNGTGTVTLTSAATGTVTIIGARAIQRTTDFVTGGDFRANTVNQEMDSQTIFSQQLQEEIDRSFKYGPWVNTAFNTTFPDPDPNKLIAWNQSGSGLINFDPLNVVNVVGQQASYADTFTGNGSQVNFTLTRTPGSIAALHVSIQGVMQTPNVDYTLSGTTLTFTTAPPAVNSIILARYNEIFAETNGDAANVRYLPAGSGAVTTNVQAKLRETVSVKDFGAVGDGVADDTAAFAAAIEDGSEIYVPEGTYVISNVVSSRTGSIIIRGVQNAVIQFTDDGTTTGIGFDFDSFSEITLSNLLIKTTGSVDGRIASGNFIGIQSLSPSAARTWNVRDVLFRGFSDAAINTQSLINSVFYSVSYRECDVGIKARSGYFPVAGTTCQFLGGYSSDNNYAHDVADLSESIWQGCIFEYNLRGINGTSGIKNTIIGCYAEQNTEYGGYWSAVSSFVFMNNYSNGAGDTWTTVGSTGSYGFDNIGSSYLNNDGIISRQIQFYDRAGVKSEILKASGTNYSGFPAFYDTAGTFLGIITKAETQQFSGFADRQIMFMLNNATAYGLPSGWTATKTGTGVWDITWPSPVTGNTRWPYIQAQGVPSASNSVGGGQVDVLVSIRARDTGGVWAAFQNMSVGFQVRIHVIDPTTGVMTLSDEAAFVQVTY